MSKRANPIVEDRFSLSPKDLQTAHEQILSFPAAEILSLVLPLPRTIVAQSFRSSRASRVSFDPGLPIPLRIRP